MTNEERATMPVLLRHSSFGIGHSPARRGHSSFVIRHCFAGNGQRAVCGAGVPPAIRRLEACTTSGALHHKRALQWRGAEAYNRGPE
jgi:hypothetical protein